MDMWRVLDDASFLDPRTRPSETSAPAARSLHGRRGRGVQLRRAGRKPKTPDRVTRIPEFDLVIRRQVWVVPHLLDVNQSGGSTTRVLGVAY